MHDNSLKPPRSAAEAVDESLLWNGWGITDQLQALPQQCAGSLICGCLFDCIRLASVVGPRVASTIAGCCEVTIGMGLWAVSPRGHVQVRVTVAGQTKATAAVEGIDNPDWEEVGSITGCSFICIASPRAEDHL